MSLKGFINKEKRNWAAKNETTQIGKILNYLGHCQKVTRDQDTKEPKLMHVIINNIIWLFYKHCETTAGSTL